MKLTAQQITKEYPRKTKTANCITVLQPLDLTLEPGKLNVLTGRSGSGKSTLLHILCGLLRPTSGTVLAEDKDLYAMTDSELSDFRNRHIGIIPQGQSAISSLTVLENVLLPVTLYGKATEPDIQRAKALLEETGIGALADCKPAELSGGELRRMAAARAMLRQPEILLADEPTSDLDAENAAILWQLLRTAAQNGAAVLTVTHEQDAHVYADRLYTMENGILQEVQNAQKRHN